jgi:uncharacterized peroxidase-related enzyme
MSKFTVHTESSAPEESRAILAGTREMIGFVPNLFGVFAESPAMLEAYTTLSGLFDKCSLGPVERQVVLLTASHANSCRYCMAAHSGLAMMAGMPESVLQLLRSGFPLPDEKLDALATYTRRLVEKQGMVHEAETEAFIDVGFTRAQVLEVILGVALKTMSNYTNHLAETPLDGAFSALVWEPSED